MNWADIPKELIPDDLDKHTIIIKDVKWEGFSLIIGEIIVDGIRNEVK